MYCLCKYLEAQFLLVQCWWKLLAKTGAICCRIKVVGRDIFGGNFVGEEVTSGSQGV